MGTLRSSNNQSGIMFTSSALETVVKFRITDSMNLLGKPTSKNFFLIRFFSFSKSFAILRALYSSPLIASLLYLIPDWLFDDRKVLTVRLPIIRIASNIRSLFPLKDRVEDRSCVIYEGVFHVLKNTSENQQGRKNLME